MKSMVFSKSSLALPSLTKWGFCWQERDVSQIPKSWVSKPQKQAKTGNEPILAVSCFYLYSSQPAGFHLCLTDPSQLFTPHDITVPFQIQTLNVQVHLYSKLPFQFQFLRNKKNAIPTQNRWASLSNKLWSRVWSTTYIYIVFLGLLLQHIEVPTLGVKLELQLPNCTTATVTQDLSHVCDLYHSLWQCWTLNPQSEARDGTCILMDSSWVLYDWSRTGTPRVCTFWFRCLFMAVLFIINLFVQSNNDLMLVFFNIFF